MLALALSPDQIVGRVALDTVEEQDASGWAVENGAVGDLTPGAVFQDERRRFAQRIVDVQSGQRAVLAVAKQNPVFAVGGAVVGIPIEQVWTDDDIRRAFDQQVVLKAFPERVAGHRDASHILEMNIDRDIAHHIIADRHVTNFLRLFAAAADAADVGGVRRGVIVLQSASDDGDLANRTDSGIDQNIGCRLLVRCHVSFDVAAADLKISNFAFANDDAALIVVADVAVGDVDLVKVEFVKEDSDSRVVIQMAVVDDDVSISLRQHEPVPSLTNGDAGQRRLHRSDQLNAVRLRVSALDLKTVNAGRPLRFPDVGPNRFGRRRTPVSSHDPQRRPRSGHDYPRRASSRDRKRTVLGQRDLNRSRDPVVSRRQFDISG